MIKLQLSRQAMLFGMLEATTLNMLTPSVSYDLKNVKNYFFLDKHKKEDEDYLK